MTCLAGLMVSGRCGMHSHAHTHTDPNTQANHRQIGDFSMDTQTQTHCKHREMSSNTLAFPPQQPQRDGLIPHEHSYTQACTCICITHTHTHTQALGGEWWPMDASAEEDAVEMIDLVFIRPASSCLVHSIPLCWDVAHHHWKDCTLPCPVLLFILVFSHNTPRSSRAAASEPLGPGGCVVSCWCRLLRPLHASQCERQREQNFHRNNCMLVDLSELVTACCAAHYLTFYIHLKDLCFL